MSLMLACGDPSAQTDTETTDGSTGFDHPTECGNGLVEYQELCDDGNIVDGDGCWANCRAPGATVLWERSFDVGNLLAAESGGDGVAALGTDLWGNVYACGGRWLDSEVTPWVAMFDPTGTLLWIRALPTEEDAPPKGMVVRPEGGAIVVGGPTLSRGEPDFVPIVGELWIHALDVHGTTLWTHERALVSGNEDKAWVLAPVAFDDGHMLVGTGQATAYSLRQRLLEYDAGGRLVRETDLQAAPVVGELQNSAVVLSLASDGANGVLVVGDARVDGTVDMPFGWMQWRDREGDLRWEQRGPAEISYVRAAATGELLVVGGMTPDFIVPRATSVRAFLPDGTVKWQRDLPVPPSDIQLVMGVALDRVGGVFTHVSVTTSGETGKTDLCLVSRLAGESGSVEWERSFDAGISWDSCDALAVDRRGFLLVGESGDYGSGLRSDVWLRRMAP